MSTSENNIINKSSAIPVMVETLDELIEILKAHCGPFSDYAVIVEHENMVAEPIFTKDGINIVRSIKYEDKLKEFTRRSLEYIGGRVDTSAGDGTTSAMIICASMLKSLLQATEGYTATYSMTEFNAAYDKLKETITEYYDSEFLGIEDYIKEHKVSPEEAKKIIKNVAYWQAYTSSHGDLELSKAISELFVNTPIQAWDGLTLESSRYETKARYKTEIDESQYSLVDVRAFPVTQVKQSLGLECNRVNSRTIITQMPPCLSYVDTADTIKKIDEAILSGEELTIICPDDFNDTATLQHFNTLFKQVPNHNVVFFLVSCRDKLNDVLGAKILGIPGVSETGEHMLTYNFKGSTLKIMEGLYPKTDADIYPYVDSHEYKDLMEHIQTVIRGLTSEAVTLNTTRALKHVQKFLFKMTVIKRPSLILGGSSYDNVAAVDVAIDAISATKKSLTKGFVLGGNKTLYKTCAKILNRHPESSEQDCHGWFIDSVLKAIMKGVLEVYTCVCYPTRDTSTDEVGTDDFFDYSENVLDRKNSRVKLDGDILYTDELTPLIIQPKTMDVELVKRFGEVALKFLKIDKIIARA